MLSNDTNPNERANNILALGELHGQNKLAREYVKKGRSVEKFREVLLNRIQTGPDAERPEIGLTPKEAERFSFTKIIRAYADPIHRKDAGFELEVCEAAAEKAHRSPMGFFVPFDVLTRDLTKGTATAGGNLVATDLLGDSFIETLRNRLKVQQAGASVLNGLVGDVAIPRQSGASTAYWVAEGNSLTESAQTFDQVTLSPKTLGAYTDFTRKLMLQSSVDIEQLVRRDLASVLAVEIDRAAINGSGSSNQPTGILNVSGIGDVAGGTNGAAPTYAHIVELLSDVANVNADGGNLAYLTNSKVRGKLLQVEKASSTGQFVFEPPQGKEDGRMLGYPTYISNNIPSNLTKGTTTDASAIIFGNFGDLLIGTWGQLDILVDNTSLSTSGGIRVVAFYDVDITVRHAESFSVMKDAIT